ncbi:hypothetical protein ET495_14780 [Xylanimonas allomyrinae]|uniref:Uncharacterized protein n=1 Tax=Xylanimonas allomyrinae TaxID=2509459 RepID=A0A4P6ERX0_9MICO|nr:hypothetical protein [Xylanimonas allomyrinae]QAY64259.1 hypothetical protein ET495_14780 [Xylanimonas allomyrinae]
MTASGARRWAGDLRAALRREAATIRARDPEVDASDIGAFATPLVVRLVLFALVGLVPLLGIRMADDVDATVFGPLLASAALAAISATAVAWLLAIMLAGLTVLVVYREAPRRASRSVSRAARESFERISTFTSTLTLVSLIAGLVGLSFGLPTRRASDLETSVLEDLLAAQLGVLLVVLAVGFVVEAQRAAADVLDAESRIFAWPFALALTVVALFVATSLGPFEPTSLIAKLLTEWLPADVGGVPRAQAVREAVPSSLRAWVVTAIVPVAVVVWVLTTRTLGVLPRLRADVAAAGAAQRARAA